jgi:hypothetical protein
MAKRIERLYAKVEGRDRVVEFSLLMHKPIEVENLLSNEFNLGFDIWTFVRDAFRSLNAEHAMNGYIYDSSLTHGLVAINKSREGLEEMLAEMGS